MEIGQILKQIREQKGLSLRELSEMCGLSASFIGQVERDETSPSMRSLMSIAQSLGIKLTDLFSSLEQSDDIVSPVVTPDKRRKIENVFPGVEMYVLSKDNDRFGL
jgi:transcriptional regulator with XRE-family HTH domain